MSFRFLQAVREIISNSSSLRNGDLQERVRGLDGKNRLLCVKDDHGKIVARVILRLLFKEEHERLDPVIYMEQYYGDSSYRESVENAAKEISSRLTISLYRGFMTCNSKSTRELCHLRSSVPYECSDAVRRVT